MLEDSKVFYSFYYQSGIVFPMKVLLTSDWHLGRIFYGQHLTEDQAIVLDQVLNIARDEKVEALVVAGDIYDRSVPPPEGVELLDGFITRTVSELGIPLLLIAGNHDSPERIDFGSGVLGKTGVYIRGRARKSPDKVTLADEFGELDFWLFPYCDPSVARIFQEDTSAEPDTAEDIQLSLDLDEAHHSEPARQDRLTHEAVFRAALSGITGEGDRRRILIAHCFAAGGSPSESERPLLPGAVAGGIESVPASVFNDFSAVFLGHLHRPQTIGGKIRYPGSLLPYSFSEGSLGSSVTIAEIHEDGSVSFSIRELVPRRRIRVVEGSLEDLIHAGTISRGASENDDYLLARLTDQGALYEPMNRLRAVYPNILHIERVRNMFGEEGYEPQNLSPADLRDDELFNAFLRTVRDSELTDEEREVFTSVLREEA